MKYKALIISAALLAAPVAFAEDQNRTGPGMPPPPQGGMREHMQEQEDGRGPEFEVRAFASTSVEMPRSPMMHKEEASSTDRERPLTARSQEREHMMASSSEYMEGTSTPPRPGIPGFVVNFFKRIFGGPHDNGNASTTPPEMRGELNGEGHAGDMEASTTIDIEASSTPRTPPQAVIQFFQNLFSRFFH